MLSFGVRTPVPPGSWFRSVGNAVRDSTGDVFLVDSYRLQRFSSSGALLDWWYCYGCRGLDVNQSTGDLYVSLFDTHKLQRYSATGTLLREWGTLGSGPGELKNPHGISVDAVTGNVYVNDTGNGRIVVFDATGNFVRTIGQIGTGPGDFSGKPNANGIAFDPDARVVYVTDTALHRVMKFTEGGTFLTKWGDPPLFADGQFRVPRSVAVDREGLVYVTDTDSERIQYFQPDGTFLGTFQGPNNIVEGPFHPRDIAINRLTNEKFVNCGYAWREDKFDANNGFLLSWGSRVRDGVYIDNPLGIAASPTTGDVFVFDNDNFLLKRFTAGGGFARQWGGSNRIDVSMPGLFGIGANSALAVDMNGTVWAGITGEFYLTDPPTPWLQRFNENGDVLEVRTRKPLLGFVYVELPRHLAIDPATNDLWVAEATLNRVTRFSPGGAELLSIPVPVPAGLTVGTDYIYVIDLNANQVRRYTKAGVFVNAFGGPGSGDGQFAFTTFSGLGIDPAGNVYVADSLNHRVQQFDPTGAFIGKIGVSGFGPGQFNQPHSVAISSDGLLMHVTDTYNDRIQVFCLGAVSACAVKLDSDADSVVDAQDNCLFVSNATQADTAGLGFLSAPDGVGDACQCGDVSRNARVESDDVQQIRSALAAGTESSLTGFCSIAGGTECDVRDVAILVRALTGALPKPVQACGAANRPPG